ARLRRVVPKTRTHAEGSGAVLRPGAVEGIRAAGAQARTAQARAGVRARRERGERGAPRLVPLGRTAVPRGATELGARRRRGPILLLGIPAARARHRSG